MNLALSVAAQRQIRLGGAQAVPGPVVGAGLPGLLIACRALVALARRRKRVSNFG